MRTKVRTFKITCDRCGKTEIVLSNWNFADLPKGWKTEDVHGCGMTDYTKTDDLCPACAKKKKK